MRDDIKIPWKEQVLWVLIFLFLVSFIPRSHPQNMKKLTDRDYVQAIVGEASNQSEYTMVCIAHALRNRGNLIGVYGYSADHVQFESKATWRKAWIAWELSRREKDTMQGHKNFQSIKEHHIIHSGDQICGDFIFY